MQTARRRPCPPCCRPPLDLPLCQAPMLLALFRPRVRQTSTHTNSPRVRGALAVSGRLPLGCFQGFNPDSGPEPQNFLAEVDPRRALALRRLREPWRKSCLQLPQLSGRGRRNTHLRSRNLQLARSCLPLCPRSFSSSLCGTRSSGQCAREQEAVPQHGRGSLPARWGQDWHQGGLAGRWSTCRQTLRLEAPL